MVSAFRQTVGIDAVRDRAEVVRAPDHALRKQKPRRQLAVGARRAHDHGEWPPAQADLQRFLGGGAVDIGTARTASHTDNVNGP